jgi:uncharacterized membrane protein
MDANPSGSLEEQVGELRARVRQLEEALHLQGIPLAETAASAPPPQPTSPVAMPAAVSPRIDAEYGTTQTAPPQPVAVPPSFGYSGSTTGEETPSIEARIGSQWFNRIGIIAVLIGMAWFLKLAIDNHWIGPLGRVLIGLLAGAGLIAWSEHFRSRGYAAFSYSLKAVGSGILYLSLWAAFSYFHLVPAAVAFAAMVCVTAFNGFMAWIQDAELLALYAIAGGLSTPILVSTGENHEVTLFTYLLLLNLAVLVLVALRPWSRLLFVSFVGTVVMFLGWSFSYYTNSQSVRTSFFLLCFFLIFAFAPRLVRVRLPDQAHIAGWDALALVVLPVANAVFGFVGLYAIVSDADAAWAEPWLAVAFAAFYLFLLRLPSRGLLRENPSVLSALHLTVAVVFLTVAIPLKAKGRWLTIGWLAEGAALLWVAARLRMPLLRMLSIFCLAIGLLALIAVNPSASTMPFFNQRFGTYLFAIAAFAFVAWIARRALPALQEDDQPPWITIAATSLLAVNALILLSICWEIHGYWWSLHWRGNPKLYHDYSMYAQFTYSAWFMLFGAILLAAGLWRRAAFLRWQALVLLAVAIAKVFLYDVSELSQGYRILSFLALGALLLCVSFVYQRDWLNLRTPAGAGRRAP